MTSFAARLLAWFELHGRKHLPWQQPRDAYRIWVSEIMLQQTQVQTVIPYFERFIASFPDVAALAGAPLDDVLHHWSGLGYYARARNLHRAATIVADEHDGRFPDDFDMLVALPGIGRSTAGAILALAYDQHHAILDGNVKRVLARHRAVAGWPGTTAVAARLWELAAEHTPATDTAAYTQAIMDLGATVCTRSNPACDICPVASDCIARKSGSVAAFPGRKPKKKKPRRETTMLIASHDAHVYLERRPESGIWGGLWSLPELGDGEIDDWCRTHCGGLEREPEEWPVLRHSFTHFDLDIRPIVLHVDAPLSKVADGDRVAWHHLEDTPPGGIAAPVDKLIKELKKSRNVSQN